MIHFNSDTFLNWQSIILEIISSIFIIIASILLIIQGFDNENYRNYGSREIKTERLLLSQFSREVYSNILNKTFIIPNSTNISNNQDYLTAEIKLNPSFDCRGVKDVELNENICQDKIINNDWTCCKAECCSRTNGGNVHCYDYNFDLENPKISNYKILTYDEEESFEDPRRRFCTYYNKYNKDIKLFKNQEINISYSQYNYEDLLLNTFPSACISESKCNENYTDCGIIDTMNKHLYVSDPEICPVNNIINEENNFKLESFYNENLTTNNKKIILRNIISEIPPIAHEYKNFYECPHEDLRNEEITIKDMNNILKNNKNIYTKIENISIPLNSIGNDIRINSKSNYNSRFYWYTTNYIGFKSEDDLIKFKNYFNKSDHKDNLLYKIGENIYPYVTPIIIMFCLIFIFLLYIMYLIYAVFHKNASTAKTLKILFIIRIIVWICMLVIESIFYGMVTNEFKKIKIEMDENYKEILDLYNKRRLQIKYLLSIILLVLAFVPLFILFVINCELNNQKIEIDNNHVNEDNNRIDNNQNQNNNGNNRNNNNNHFDNNNNRQNNISSSRNNLLLLNRNENQRNNNNNNNNINNNVNNNNIIINNNNHFNNKKNNNNISNYNNINNHNNINNNINNINIVQNINNSNLTSNKISSNFLINNENNINIINNGLHKDMNTINHNKNSNNVKEDNKDSEKESNINNRKEINNQNNNINNAFNTIINEHNENDNDKEEESLQFNNNNVILDNQKEDNKLALINNRKSNKKTMRKNNKTFTILHKDNNIFSKEDNKNESNKVNKRLLTEPNKDKKTTIDRTNHSYNDIKNSENDVFVNEEDEIKI